VLPTFQDEDEVSTKDITVLQRQPGQQECPTKKLMMRVLPPEFSCKFYKVELFAHGDASPCDTSVARITKTLSNFEMSTSCGLREGHLLNYEVLNSTFT